MKPLILKDGLGIPKDLVVRRILSASLLVSGTTLAIKCVSALKEVFVASNFGSSADMDNYILAFSLVSFITALISGSLEAAFIPVYIRVREHEGVKAAQELISTVSLLVGGLSLACVVFLLITSPLALKLLTPYGRVSSELHVLFFWLLPTVPLSGLKTLWGCILNSGERFFLTSIVPIVTPISIVASMYCFYWIGVLALVIGTVAGAFLEMCITGHVLRRQGISLSFRFFGLTDDVRTVFKQITPMVAGFLVLNASGLVDQGFAARIGTGSVSALNYGNKIISLVLGLSTTALSVTILPHLSKMVVNYEWGRILKTYKFLSFVILAVSVPVTLLLFMCSGDVVNLIFRHGKFTPANAAVVTHVQAYLALQLPFHMLSILSVRLISTFNQNRYLLIGNIITLLFNIVLDAIFMRIFGVAGIALATSLDYMISFLFLFIVARVLILQKMKTSKGGADAQCV